MYAYHSQWNRTPTYQLTKSNILDVSRTEGVASNTHRDKSKRNEEKTSRVITFCHLHELPFFFHQETNDRINLNKRFQYSTNDIHRDTYMYF